MKPNMFRSLISHYQDSGQIKDDIKPVEHGMQKTAPKMEFHNCRDINRSQKKHNRIEAERSDVPAGYQLG